MQGFFEHPEVAAKIKPLRPKLPRKIPVQLKVEPRSKRYTLVGSAFDYLLRFELQRLAPHAVSHRWISEEATKLGVFKDGSGEFFIAIVSRDGNGRMLLGPEPEKEEDLIRQMRAGRDTEMERRIRSVVENANACVGCFVSDKSATPPAPTRRCWPRHSIGEA